MSNSNDLLDFLPTDITLPQEYFMRQKYPDGSRQFLTEISRSNKPIFINLLINETDRSVYVTLVYRPGENYFPNFLRVEGEIVGILSDDHTVHLEKCVE